MDKLKMHSPNLVDSNIEKIAALFPNCVTEAQGEYGELKKAIDFDLLKQELSQVIVEGEQERYRLDWVGKKEAILTANAPIAKTLRPCREESVNFDKTENLFIEGDNLEALKLLQENYLGKVKMIYIDPPYNTGNDFIYEDDFAESTEVFFEKSNQVDDEGNRLIANTESNGRFHSDWLSMMYSRLKLARTLLKEDGVLFCSIDDNEIDNISNILKEIFGNSKVEIYTWDTREKGKMPKTAKNTVRKDHEYLIAAFKNSKKLYKYISYKYKNQKGWGNVDNDHRGNWMSANISRGSGEGSGGKNSYTITNPNGDSFYRDWSISEVEFKELLADNRIYFSDNGKGVPRKKIFQNEPVEGIQSSIFDSLSSSQTASNLIKDLMGEKFFDYPKPVDLINRIINISTQKEGIVLDFFAGSSTTAHAVMQLNAEDGGNRKFIMVQFPEETNEKSEAFKAGYKTIAEISKERIRRAGKKILEDNATKEGIENLDIGFRVLKIDSTNMKDVYYTPDAFKQADMLDLASNIKEDRTSEDLLFQVMLDWGLELSLPIERKTIAGKEVFYVAGNSLVACFEDLTFDVVDEIAKDHPLRFVSAEKAIHLDHDKTNIKERFKQLSPDTEVKFL